MIKQIDALEKLQTLTFKHGGNLYTLAVHLWDDKDGAKNLMHVMEADSYAPRSMNVQGIDDEFLHLYDYNFMGGRSSGKMAIKDITDIIVSNIPSTTTI